MNMSRTVRTGGPLCSNAIFDNPILLILYPLEVQNPTKAREYTQLGFFGPVIIFPQLLICTLTGIKRRKTIFTRRLVKIMGRYIHKCLSYISHFSLIIFNVVTVSNVSQ